MAEGDISELHIGLKSTMSALALKDWAQKTRRGLEGRVRAGHSGGGLSFDCKVVRRLRADGTPVTGELEIAPDEAGIVQRVFSAYAGGQSPRAIAKRLNVEGVAGPRGGKWTSVLLLGGAKRETGMLRDRFYIGERVWNRQRFVKDPSTGKRVARINPREAWIVKQVPTLAIIDEELWAAAQARLEAGRRSMAVHDVLPGVVRAAGWNAPGPACGTPDARRRQAPNAHAAPRPGDARGLEVSLRSFFQNQLVQRQLRHRLP